MQSWKTAEEATIRFYEEVDLFQRGVVVPNPDSQYGDDAISTTQANKRYELKTCYSTYHHPDLYRSFGFNANDTAYLRLDQLKRYRREDLADPDIHRLIYIDRRLVDLTYYEPIQGVKRFVGSIDIPYQIKKQWTVTIATTAELRALVEQHKTSTSVVPAETRLAYCNNPQWDGVLLNFPTTELRTIDLTSQIKNIGVENLVAHRLSFTNLGN